MAIAKKQQADFLLTLATLGLPISEEHKQSVRSRGLARELAATEKDIEEDVERDTEERHLWLYEVPIASEGEDKGKPFEGVAYFDRIPSEWKKEFAEVDITRDMWRRADPTAMDRNFRNFISSHIPKFDNLLPYKEFYLYCEQARRWEQDTEDYSDLKGQEQWDWVQRELGRIADNKLYGLNRYITIKEDNKAGGRRKYRASTPQALIAFLVDRGNSWDLLKGRQQTVTSTMMAIACLEAATMNSYKGVFVTHDKQGTGQTLFEDKFKNTWQHLPNWIIKDTHASNWRGDQVVIDFDPGDSKSEKKRNASYFDLLGSDDTQKVNGRTPTRVYFDETQQIWSYQVIKAEIDPTMYQFNEATGKMDLVRAVYAWATGSSNTIGQGAFEADFTGLLQAWNSGEDTFGWLPVFFNWTCRPGVNQAFYRMMKKKYLRGQTSETKGLSTTERLSLFRAHYPSQPADAFMAAHKTIIPQELIHDQQLRIESQFHSQGGMIHGRFVPIFDESQPVPPGGYFPFVVRDVKWEPTPHNPNAPIRMFMDRQPNWANRYFQGTDPISNDGGFSLFASAIWDTAARVIETDEGEVHLETVACRLNHRTPYPEELFVQSILMGMYYKNVGQRACRELVEWNDGKKYVEMKTGPIFNLGQSLIVRGELPTLYRGGTHPYGIDLKNGRNGRKTELFHDASIILIEHRHNLWDFELWTQISNIVVETKTNQSIEFAAKKNCNDDLFYAAIYAKLAANTINKKAVKLSAEKPEMKRKKVWRRDMNSLTLYEEEILVPAKY